MVEALVTPQVLAWARNRRGLEPAELAHKLSVKPERVLDWESGERRPTFRQARRLAESLYVPFGYLYLSEPPEEELPLPDFRTTPGQPPREPSPDFLDLLNDVLGKQQWFRSYRESEGTEELPFVGSFSSTDSEETVAADIRDVINVDAARSVAGNWEGFIRELTRNAEDVGIMVLRSGVVGNNNFRPLDIEEFRGFSVSDRIAPLIFVNGRDFTGAQIFTLAHELAHIWAGQGGVSNPDYGLRHDSQDQSIERFCNRVAAETLVPGEEFSRRWKLRESEVDDNLHVLSRSYKVSQMVILRQALDHGFVSAANYRRSYRDIVERANQRVPSGETGGHFQYTLAARNGNTFVQAVVSSAAGGTLLSSEAADLLGVKVSTLPSVAEHHFGSRLHLG